MTSVLKHNLAPIVYWLLSSFETVHDNYNLKSHKYMCITTYQPGIKSIPNPTTKQHTIVNIQLNTVTCPTYPDKFIRDMLLHRLCDFSCNGHTASSKCLQLPSASEREELSAPHNTCHSRAFPVAATKTWNALYDNVVSASSWTFPLFQRSIYC